MWFKNIFIYRIKNWNLNKIDLEAALLKNQLRECTSLEAKTTGWLPVNDIDFVHATNKQLLICLGQNKKILPPSVVLQQVKARAKKLSISQGHDVSRRQIKELKEAITDELLMRAFSVESKTYGWIDPIDNWIVLNTASKSKADEFIKVLSNLLNNTTISTIKTNRSPSKAMQRWLISDSSISSFTTDQDCELSIVGKTSRSVKYTGYTLEKDEIQKHIKEGMEVTKLSLTWNNRISFTLENTFQLKKIIPLDIIKDKYLDEDNDDLFEAEFTIMYGELKQLLKDIIEELDGEV